jgi:uncharacterized protein YpuA (DUF1002 family)
MNRKEGDTVDIKSKIEELTAKIKNDKDFEKKFKENPVKAVEEVLGVDLPDDKVNSIVDGVKAHITADNVKNTVGGLFDKIKK